ncbi:MAG: FtsX-like permease family protein [Planctomycetes bacterium]|nr:FtsX-like permease family protein [Planctomycetota bacterium]
MSDARADASPAGRRRAGRARTRLVLGVLLADARRHRLVFLTTLLGVAVGIAVVVAIRLSSQAALESFRGTFVSLTGRATHQLTAIEPMDPARLLELRRAPGVLAVDPVVAATLVVPAASPEAEREAAHRIRPVLSDARGPRALRLVGIDPFQAGPFLELDAEALGEAADGRLFERMMCEPGLVAADRSTLASLGLPDGGDLHVEGPHGPLVLHAVAIDEPRLAAGNPPFLLADIATAQDALGLGDRVLRYDLVLDGDGSDLPLRKGERLDRPERRGERADTMTEAFRTNLQCLGFLAVLVGAFLAFNMAQFAVTRRRTLLGRLRCLGCPGRDLVRGVLAEAALLGVAGGVLGVAGGALLARGMVADVALTVSTLYGPTDGVPVPHLDAVTAAAAIGVGVLATVAASVLPARAAGRVAPIAVAQGASRDGPAPAWLPLLLLALGVLSLVPSGSAAILPAISVLCVLLATATAMPRLLGFVVRHLPRGPVTSLAAGRIERTLGRTGAAAGALVMPLAMTVAIVVMVDSFRAEVSTWTDAVLGADVYAKPLHLELAPETAALSPELVAEFEALPEVLAVDRLRLWEDPRRAPFLVAGARLEMIKRRGSLRVLEGPPLDVIVPRLLDGEALVSEPLANRRGLHPGDTLVLPGRDGDAPVTVAAVFQDFSFDRGYVLLSEDEFVRRLGEIPVRSAALLLREGEDPAALADALAARHPDVEFTTVARLRDEVMAAFHDTFAITWVLAGISTALALVGIVTALLCLHLERRHELGVLRALGARLSVVLRMLAVEAAVIMGTAALAALPAGLALAWILVAVVNTRSFGWSFPMAVDPQALLLLSAMALGASLVAVAVPWTLVRRTPPARLLETRR